MTLNHTDANQQQQSAEAFILSQNPEKALQDTIETIEALQDVYVRETQSLKAANTQDFLALQDEKLQTAQKYQSSIKQILKRKEEMQTVSPALKAKLQDMQEGFSQTSKSNLEEIQRMQRTVDRLGNTIRKAAKETARRLRGHSYSQTGKIEGEDKKTVSMGINETA